MNQVHHFGQMVTILYASFPNESSIKMNSYWTLDLMKLRISLYTNIFLKLQNSQ